MVARLIRVLLPLALLCIGASEATAALLEDRQAIRSIVALVSSDARAEFLRRAEDFSVDQSFTLKTGPTRPDGKHFLLQMRREDVEIILLNPFNDPTEFRIYFYRSQGTDQAVAAIDGLATDLREALSKVPGVILRELKTP